MLFPIIGGLLALAGAALGVDAALRFHRAILVVSVVATGVSGMITASRFSRGDRLLTSWALVGAGYLLAAVRHGVRLVSFFEPSVVLPTWMNNIFAIAQNLAIAAALLLFVLAWHATGLTAPLSRQAQVLSVMIGFAIAVLAGGYPLLKALETTQTNPILLVSTAGDIVGLALIVPLALSALAMRGGLLMHTWIYLAASELAWLLYDVWWAMQPSMAIATNWSNAIVEAMRIVAVLCAFVATVAQRRAMG